MTRARLDSTTPTPARLRRYLQVVECRYPRVWEQLGTLRRMHSASGLWPSWCDLPLSRVHEVVCPEDAARDPTRLVDVAIVGGLAAWRVHQTICSSDGAAWAIDRPLDLDVPPDHLHALLERPVYFELPQECLGSPATGATRGALVHLTCDDRTQVAELRLLIERTRRWTLGSVPLVPLAVPLTEPTLADCLDAIVREHLHQRERLARYAVAGELAVALHGLVRVCVGLVVHLLDPTRSLLMPLSLSEPDVLAPDLDAESSRVEPDPAAPDPLDEHDRQASPFLRRFA